MNQRRPLPTPWGLLTGKLKTECSHQCEDCGDYDDPEAGQPLRLCFKDGNVSNRKRANLLMLCPECFSYRVQTQIRAAAHRRHQPCLPFRRPI